jgi:3-hydroxybutyryl-CoA dehydrogenase
MDARDVIGVVGAGVMGAGIAQVAAAAGHRVKLHDAKPGLAAQAKEKTAASLARLVEKGKMAATEREALLGRIEISGSLGDLAPAKLVLEAVIEDVGVKRGLLARLEKVVAPDAVLATNTSSLLIEDIAAGLARPQRLAGLHFFNPAPLMPLVEVVAGKATERAVADALFALARAWGKTPVRCESSPGFIVNRGARPFYAEPLRFLEEGGVDAATVDSLLRATGFKMGPLELIDLVGLDINLAATRSIYAATGHDARYEPSRLVQDLVAAGRSGRKTGKGFHEYSGGGVGPHAEAANSAGEPAGPPEAIEVVGTLGTAEPVVARLEKSGVCVERRPGAAPGWIVMDGTKLALTDGRTASARGEGWAVFDFSLDYGACPRLGVDGANFEKVSELLRRAGIQATPLPDRPGLLVARTIAALANEAADIVLRGVASAADVDTAMQMGLNFPGGPLGWADRLGADYCAGVLDALAPMNASRYRVCPLLREKAATGGKFHA